ncbi:hypothetical protein [Archangium sp.]|uniref:hypothetical protein n=1 Tax=Archangium sp. TaxID=1872627 RepID=UPI00389AF246
MNPPTAFSNKLLALYTLSFAATIAALVVDLQRGVVLFGYLGLVGSIVTTTLLLYRAARAMAFSPTADRLAAENARLPSGEQRPAA